MAGDEVKEPIFQTISEIVKTAILVMYSIFANFVHLIWPSSRRKMLNGEIALVTGSANGLGSEICRELASLGVKVVCWDIEGDKNEKLVDELRHQGYSAWGYVVNVSDTRQIETTSKKVLKEVGPVSIIINNAALLPVEPMVASEPSLVQKVFQVNVISQFVILKEFLPQMIMDNKGSVVSICSVVGLMGNAYQSLYSSTKFAINGYMESIRYELAEMAPNVQVMSVYPTGIQTRAAFKYKAQLRFPSITPILEAKYVARRVAEGLERGDEYVYCPRGVQLTNLSHLLPFGALRLIKNFMMPGFRPNNENDSESD